MNGSRFCFEASKSGELTCSHGGKYLHSKYNPVSEGEKFVQTLLADFSPFCVFIIEPALSYCVPFLRKKFPSARICAIRFFEDFSETDKLWDFVFYLQKNKKNASLCEDLFNYLGEEKLISSVFFDFPSTKQIFQEESQKTWQEIKNAVLKARDVIGTRAYFAKRWLKNSLIFAQYIQNAVILEKTNLPVIIAASGPSLETSIPFLKQFRASFFLLAVSSAFMPLLKNEIIPDFVMSSDGGFWAKKHLDFPKSDCDTIFALESESAIPKKLLESKKILPLVYEDSLGKDFLDSLGLPYLLSKRNGTVAGTALEFALSFTKKNIYLCGLDQAPSSGFQHTQPNALEIDNAKTDFRLRSAETRIMTSRFRSEKSLEIYRNWFVSNSAYFKNCVFRLSDNFKYLFGLGEIKEKNWQDFENEKRKAENGKRKIENEKWKTESGKLRIENDERKKILFSKLKELSQTQKFVDEVFPMDSILIKRELDEKKKTELEAKLREKIAEFLNEECRALFAMTALSDLN